MRHFQAYLYENSITAQDHASADTLRRTLRAVADPVLSAVIHVPCGTYRYTSACQTFSAAVIDNCIKIGLLRRCGDALLLDSPVILEEDAETLTTCFTAAVNRMADLLVQNQPAYSNLAESLNNGFPPDINLYHLLCGRILDGYFFECLSRNGIISTAKPHASGLSYLITLYEASPALDRLSKTLLCSYNRYTDGICALQSFGDSDGERTDFYRFAAQKALGTVSSSHHALEMLWDSAGCSHEKRSLLAAVQQLSDTGDCSQLYLQLLTLFGYAHDHTLTVPVYRKEHQTIIEALETLTEQLLYSDMEAALTTAATQANLLCVWHGVAAGDITNELYHILFGKLNKALVSRKFVAKPAYRPGEGRYLQSIEVR